MSKPGFDQDQRIYHNLSTLLYLMVMVMVLLAFLVYQLFNDSEELLPLGISASLTSGHVDLPDEKTKYDAKTTVFWVAPDLESIKSSALYPLVEYGKELITHTSRYLGPNGQVARISNGMNCQNCHLDAGTKIYGNNYGSVYSTYPKFRARSGSTEDIYKRVNDCFERSLNGKPLDTLSKEMQSIKAYLMFLSRDVQKGTTVKGSGLIALENLTRPADPVMGRKVYTEKCMSCHMADGRGVKTQDGMEYSYPPLWGPASYNDAAGLYRISNFARYAKANMPLGATYDKPQLTDEEAWDVAAYVNSRPRPHKVTADWPDISKKPVDHPFGPYDDGFSETQHKFGPFDPITEKRKVSAKSKI